jgi:heme-degrading monooxygenase HmoA
VFARVSIYEVPVERVRDAAETFGQAIGQIRTMENLAAAYLLVDADSGKVLTMTLWDSVAAMEASRVAASRLRSDAVRTVQGSVQSTDEYEVVARELGDAE